jgi:murein DD-endopeptidase MepM/ murein hydrolase activator NlpD
MSGGFLLVVLAAVLVIVLLAPQYAEPAVGAALLSDESPAPTLGEDAIGAEAPVEPEVMTSKPPDKLRGYRWPVRGGTLDTFYEASTQGDFEIAGKRVHDGLVITWFDGAVVKAAHKGTVVAAGRDWAEHVGFDGSLVTVYDRYAPIEEPKKGKKAKPSRKPPFPEGIVIDDGNGYYSVYTEIKDLRVKRGDEVAAGQPIAAMDTFGGKQMMRYRLVRMDGPWMMVHQSARNRGYPYYARERVDPLAVLEIEARNMPLLKRQPPANPPQLSSY